MVRPFSRLCRGRRNGETVSRLCTDEVRKIGIARGRWFRFDDDLAAIVEHDAVNAADARRSKQIARDCGVERAPRERIDRGEDVLRIARTEDVELDERSLPLREVFGDHGNRVAHDAECSLRSRLSLETR